MDHDKLLHSTSSQPKILTQTSLKIWSCNIIRIRKNLNRIRSEIRMLRPNDVCGFWGLEDLRYKLSTFNSKRYRFWIYFFVRDLSLAAFVAIRYFSSRNKIKYYISGLGVISKVKKLYQKILTTVDTRAMMFSK